MMRIMNAISINTGLDYYPISTDNVESNCIVYKYYQVAPHRYRLELRLITHSFADAETLSAQILSTICDFGDKNKITGISSIQINGGGISKDFETNTIHKLMYFDVYKEN